MPPAAPEPPSRRVPPRVIALIGFLAASLAFFGIALSQGWLRPDTIQDLVAGAGPWAMVGYVVVVIAAELLWAPRLWGLLAGGVLFGPVIGGALSLVADLGSAAICYGIARGAGRTWVEARLAARPRAKTVVELFTKHRGGATMAVLRMCPIAHYTLVSYAAGVAGVSAPAFMIGTAVGILPGAILYPLVGDAALRPLSPVFFVSMGILAVFLVATLAAGRRVLARHDATTRESDRS